MDVLQRAYVPWSQLWVDVLLLAAGFLFPFISFVADVRAGCPEWFHRSGAVTVLLSGIVAWHSLSKHYEKLFNLSGRGTALRTSRNQSIIDRFALGFSILGTVVWGYGDMLFKVACK